MTSKKSTTKLLPINVIESAIQGDTEAMMFVLNRYRRDIEENSKRYIKNQYGELSFSVDEYIRDELRIALMLAITKFEMK